MNARLSFLREIEATVAHSSGPRRAEMARHLTDLFLVNAEQYSDDEIAVIDDVFVRLVATLEDSARSLLAIRLGPYAKAPPKILSALACDDVIDIASPVLTQGVQLADATLIKCAKTKSQEHLLAISRRKTLAEAVTDVLVARGDQQVVLSTAKNPGAKFSSGGFTILVDRSKDDDLLAACVGARPDIPPQLFEKLLDAASEVVRRKLIAEIPHARRDIHRVVVDATEKLRAKAATQSSLATAAEAPGETQKLTNKSEIEKLDAFAKAGRFEATIAALARQSNMPTEFIERKLREDHVEILLILAKAIGLSWQTTNEILVFSAGKKTRSLRELKQHEESFARLSRLTAQKILDFHRKRERPPTKPH
jgi:uncharacterized protein (DUF2336 family)